MDGPLETCVCVLIYLSLCACRSYSTFSQVGRFSPGQRDEGTRRPHRITQLRSAALS